MLPKLWIDTHIHVSDRSSDGSLRETLAQDVLKVLDEAESDLRFVVSPDSFWNRVVKTEPDGSSRANEFIHRLVDAAPGRLYGSCIVNPNFVEDSLRTMETCFERWGFVQLGEFLQYMFDFKMDSDDSERLVRKAVEYDVPVEIHVSTSNSAQGGWSGGCEQLEDIFGLVQRVPEAKIIVAHAVGTDKDDPPVIDTYLDLIEKEYGHWPDNWWAEIRDFSSPGVPSALVRIPASRLIAGTDWTTRVGPPFLPYGMVFGTSPEENPYLPCLSEMVGFLRRAGATSEAIDQIAYKNGCELMKIGI